MPIAIDASTPALVTGGTSATTASFTAPTNSLLVAVCAFGVGIGTTSVVNSGTGLTWTLQESSATYDANPSIFTAPAPISAARTVTAQTTSPVSTALKLLVVTGADLTAPVGATGAGDSTTPNLTAPVYTSTVAGSRAVGIATDSNADTTPTSSDVGFGFSLSSYSGTAVHKAADTATPGTGVTLNFNGGAAARLWDWAAIEILPLVTPFLPSRGRVLGQAINRAATY